jgi:hypothetical protein
MGKTKKVSRPEFTHWKEWVLLTNKEKTDVYPSLTIKEKDNIWTKEYMKVIRLNMRPIIEGEEE